MRGTPWWYTLGYERYILVVYPRWYMPPYHTQGGTLLVYMPPYHAPRYTLWYTPLMTDAADPGNGQQ